MPICNRSTGLMIVATMLCLTLAGTVAAPTMAVTAQTPAVTPTIQAEENQPSNTFGFGQPATQEEIGAWDTDVRPDGTGLPAGRGSVTEGAKLYALHCAGCHSPDGRESPVLLPFRSLVGEYDPATWPTWPLTIGNYWPYAPSVFDYIRRAMPYTTPGILTDDEVYAITAWLLNQNGLLPDDAVLDATTLPQVKMPALQHYVPHDWRDSYPYQ